MKYVGERKFVGASFVFVVSSLFSSFYLLVSGLFSRVLFSVFGFYLLYNYEVVPPPLNEK